MKPTHTHTACALLIALGLASPAFAITRVLDFDTDAAGNQIVAGQIIDDEYADWGINITVDNFSRTPAGTIDPNKDFGVAFDTQNPTGSDGDLQTPGSGLNNNTALGNVLIIQENGHPDDSGDFLGSKRVKGWHQEANGSWDWGWYDRPYEPDDEGSRPAGMFDFMFDAVQSAGRIDFLDIEQGGERGGTISFFNNGTELTSEQLSIADLGNNSFQSIDFSGFEYDRMMVRLAGSGAITEVSATSPDPRSEPTPIPEPVTGTLTLLGLGALAMRATQRRRG